jgi:hypothetical protein
MNGNREAELEAEIVHLRSYVDALKSGQETLIQCIAEMKTDVEQVAQEAWEAARLVNGDTLMDTWLVFEDWWQSRGKK